MPKSTTPSAPARRALIEDIKDDRRGWVQHGVAALAVSLLGLGVAGSVALTGSAQSAQLAVPAAKVATTNPDVKLPSAFARDAESTSRDTARPALDQARLQSLADQRAEELSKTDDQIEQAANTKAAAARDKTLESASKATQKEGALIVRRKAAEKVAAAAAAAAAATRESSSSSSAPAAAPRKAAPAKSAPVTSSGGRCMPVRGGYSIAARFGQVGSWSRYHTGMDVSAPLGSTVQSPDAGVVTNAGPGPASGWAGNYVAIRHADGTTSMSSHMSTVTVSVGQSVGGCQTVGAVGMTGRTFGPHVHFEIYPSGVTPGDVYSAVNPAGWLAARGVTP